MSEHDKTELREFASVQRVDDMWLQLCPKIASDTVRWVRQFAEEDIDASPDLSSSTRIRAKGMLDHFVPAAEADLMGYLKSFDSRNFSEYLAIDVYGSLFEIREVRKLTAFYKTSTGQKLLSERSAITTELEAGEENLIGRHFSGDEIDEVMVFYRSPEQRHVQSKMAVVQERIETYYERQLDEEVHKLERQLADAAISAAR